MGGHGRSVAREIRPLVGALQFEFTDNAASGGRKARRERVAGAHEDAVK
jgi:hypothetical protein